MPLFALFIGAILVAAAIRDTQGTLFEALGTDIPAYVVWATAIIVVGSIGFIPGLKPISRGLIVLILVVLILRNYQNVITGFNSAWQPSSGTASGNASTPGLPGAGGWGTPAKGGVSVTSVSSDFNSFSSAYGVMV